MLYYSLITLFNWKYVFVRTSMRLDLLKGHYHTYEAIH